MAASKAHHQRVLDALQKGFGKSSSRLAREGGSSDIRRVIPTGIDVLDHHILGCGGVPLGRVGEIFSDAGAGKAQPCDEPVLTPTGWVPIGSLEPGDFVIGSDGNQTKVIGVYPQGRRKVFRIETSDGASTRACAEHLWSVRTQNHERRGQAAKVRSTADLRSDLLQGRIPWRLPMVKAVQLPDRDLPVDPYLLGVLLGDGCLSSGALASNQETDVVDRCLARLPEGDCGSWDGSTLRIRKAVRTHRADGALEASRTREALHEAGLMGKGSHEKFVPSDYLYGSETQRRQLLRGLLDTDGHVASAHCIEYSTTSPELALAVEWLARSLGGQARTVERTTHYTHKGEQREGRLSFRVYLRVPGPAPVSSAKHLARYTAPEKLVRRLTAIVEDGVAECVCIKVAAEDSLYVTQDLIVTHNTSLGAQLCGAFQAAGGSAIYMETENALHVPRMTTFGVDAEELILVEPATVEETLKMMRSVVQSIDPEVPTIIVWDSLAGTEMSAQAEAELGDAKLVGKRGKLFSESLPVLCTEAMKARAAMVIINQQRDNIGVTFGNQVTTPGGNAVKYHTSWRLQMWKGAGVKKGEDVIGQHVTIKAVKNKVAVPFRKARVRLYWDRGWDNDWSILQMAKDAKILKARARLSADNLLAARKGLWPHVDWDALADTEAEGIAK